MSQSEKWLALSKTFETVDRRRRIIEQDERQRSVVSPCEIPTGAQNDEEPKRWITTKNDVKVPVGEGENNKEACNEFFEDKEQHEKDMKHSFESQKDMMTLLAMDYPEFKETVSGINTLYKSKYKNKKNIKHITPGFIYKAKNHGFNNYEFYDKIVSDDTRKDWD